MKIKEELLKFDMVYVFYAISEVYGYHQYMEFCNYLKEMYGLDPSYRPVDIIDVMSEEEIALNITVYFDSNNNEHINKVKLKDKNNEKLLSYLRKTFQNDFKFPTYNEWITFEEGCELPDEWEGVIVAAPQHKSKIMHCVYANGEFHTLGIKNHVIIPKKFMRINVSNITIKDDYTYEKSNKCN